MISISVSKAFVLLNCALRVQHRWENLQYLCLCVAVNFVCDHPAIKAISFVGSNQAGEYIYERGSKNGKRVQSNMVYQNSQYSFYLLNILLLHLGLSVSLGCNSFHDNPHIKNSSYCYRITLHQSKVWTHWPIHTEWVSVSKPLTDTVWSKSFTFAVTKTTAWCLAVNHWCLWSTPCCFCLMLYSLLNRDESLFMCIWFYLYIYIIYIYIFCLVLKKSKFYCCLV